MAETADSRDLAGVFQPDALAAAEAAWKQLLKRRNIPPEQANFGAVARRDILTVFGHDGTGEAPEPTVGVAAGFFFRDNDGDGQYTPGEALTAVLLGSPRLTGPDAPAIRTYANCFWFGPLQTGRTYTLTYDVHGFETFSKELTVEPGLNLLHVPVAPTGTLVYVVSHSHFDPEWRDTYEGYLNHELPQLVGRLHLLRQQPEHCFNLDEECAARPLIECHPELREELRQRVLEGVVEIKGLVTAGELTMPLGESMIRQMTEGEQWISRLLGVEIRPETCWNIDCYGINFQLPQILAKAGRKYFVMGEYNHHMAKKIVPTDLPFSDPEAWKHPEFWLEGLDGSKVLLHRSPYGTEPRGPQFFNERVRSHRSVFNFEGGDFCPARLDLPERLKELNDPQTAAKFDGVMDPWGRPHMTRPAGECKFIIATSEQFFRAVETADDLPTIRTESRIGFWTGSYESRVRGRQLSRQTESMLLAGESLSTAAVLAGMHDVRDDLRQAWYLLLINHHHDPQLTVMAPGLFDEVLERYLESRGATQKILDGAVAYLTRRIATDAQDGRPMMVFNSLAWPRSDVVTVDLPARTKAASLGVVDAAGNAAPSQVLTDGRGRTKRLAFLAADVPAAGWRTYFLHSGAAETVATGLRASQDLLENEHVRVELADGLVQRITEKSSGRCLFAAGDAAAVNEVFIWEDEGCIAQIRPVDFMNSARLLARSSQAPRTTSLAEAGPVRAVVETSFQLEWGRFTQRVILAAGARWLDFETHVDWRPAEEGGRRVRVAFPSALTDAAVWRDIPFAVLPWQQTDAIQPINSWLAVADADGTVGAALIHDGPCSQQVRHDCLWQTLFRSVRMPGKVEDMKHDPPCGWDLSGDTALVEGQNTYRYRLVPFAGSWRHAAMPRLSLEFTTPLLAQRARAHRGKLPAERSHLLVEPDDLVPCVWKRADHSNAMIVRVYNPTADTIRGVLRVGFPLASAAETNFREEHAAELTLAGNEVALEFGRYEIKTIRLVPAR